LTTCEFNGDPNWVWFQRHITLFDNLQL
jgi:hypothetical protein